MRNLKRALSLALAAVMVLGMMVIGAGAASTYDSFTDKDEIVNKEAVNTMVSLGVLAGKNDGSSFDPTGIVTRAEMAKIIAVSLNGGKDPVMGSDAKTTFSDVPANHWAVAYIAYCVQQEIIAGRGNGTFGPEEPVTGSAAAKMFLCALGYKANLEGLVGNNWEINTNVLANQNADLYDGLEGLNASQGLSRDNTAQMLYNAVQAQEVYYDNLQGSHTDVLQTFEKGTMLANRFGVAKVEGVVVANNIMAIDDDGTTVAGKARLNDIQQNGVAYTDKDGKSIPATYPVALGNEYLGRRVVLYVKGLKDLSPNASSMTIVGEPILSDMNTVAETAKRMKDDAAVRKFLSENDLSLSTNVKNTDVNGTVAYTEEETVIDNTVPERSFAVDGTSNVNGTEFVFIDHNGDGQVDYIFKTLPKMAKVTVYNETDKKLTIAGEGSIDFADIANEEDVAKDDIVLYHRMNDTWYVQKAETVSGKVSSYNDSTVKVTVDGTEYGKSTVKLETSSTDLTAFDAGIDLVSGTYTFYMDAHGNVVAWIVGEEELGNYALVLASDKNGSSVVTGGEIKLLLSDGTTATYDVNLLASANKFGLTGTTSAKEEAMANMLETDLAALPTPKLGLMNTIVNYVVGENNKVTIGDPSTVKNYNTISVGDTVALNGVDYTAAAGGEDVTRSTSRYSFKNSGGDNLASLSVNDSTIFFFRNATDGAGARPGAPGYDGTTGNNTYSVVQGLSQMPTSVVKKSNGRTEATVESIAYINTAANPNVAKAVFVDGKFEGATHYVYVSDSYTGTKTVNGEEVYTYPVVFEDGTVGTLNANGGNYDDGLVYQYVMDASGVADLDLPDPDSSIGKSGVVNGVVSTYARGSNLSVEWGDGSGAVKSYTVKGGANLWNVENTPYKETLTDGMSMAMVIDADGFVQSVFVKKTNVVEVDIRVASGVDMTGINLAHKATDAANTKVYNSFSVKLYGVNLVLGDNNVEYVIHYDNKSTETKKVNVTSKKILVNGIETVANVNAATFSVPDDVDYIEITKVVNSATPVGLGLTVTPETVTADGGTAATASASNASGAVTYTWYTTTGAATTDTSALNSNFTASGATLSAKDGTPASTYYFICVATDAAGNTKRANVTVVVDPSNSLTVTIPKGSYGAGTPEVYLNDARVSASNITEGFSNYTFSAENTDVVIIKNTAWASGDIVDLGDGPVTIGANQAITITLDGTNHTLPELYTVQVGAITSGDGVTYTANKAFVADGVQPTLTLTVARTSTNKHEQVTFTGATVGAIGSNLVKNGASAIVAPKVTINTNNTVELTTSAAVTDNTTITNDVAQVFAVGAVTVGEGATTMGGASVTATVVDSPAYLPATGGIVKVRLEVKDAALTGGTNGTTVTFSLTAGGGSVAPSTAQDAFGAAAAGGSTKEITLTIGGTTTTDITFGAALADKT